MKRISALLALVMVLTLCASCAAPNQESENRITYADGSYLLVSTDKKDDAYTTTRDEIPESLRQNAELSPVGCSFYYTEPRTKGFTPSPFKKLVTNEEGELVVVWCNVNGEILYDTTFATKFCRYYSADGRLLWTMTINALFKENNLEHYCQIINCNVHVWETDSWYVIGEDFTEEAESVSYSVSFGRTNLGVTIAQPSYTIQLSRDENGNFH